jgi:alkylation response protein AidB-like acyl-CoA dehydrogenase
MDARLSAEQQALRDSAVQLVDRLGPRVVAEIGDHERVARLDAAVAAAGWRELRVAAEEGGSPLASGVEVAIVAEELARRCADVAFLGPTLAAELRRLAGMPKSASNETVVLTADLSTVAVVGDLVPFSDAVAIDAAGSSNALVLDAVYGGFALGEVHLSAPAPTVDLTRPSVVLDRDAKVRPLADDRAVISAEDVTAWTALGLAVACADLVGSMHGALDLARGYATERRQYGAAIGSFQAVQHLLADAHVALEGSRSVARHAAWAVDALDPDDALAAAAVAKAFCARAARAVCETAIQVHGGIGNTWECLAHVHLRRALVSADVFGGAGASIERVLRHHGIGDGDGLS